MVCTSTWILRPISCSSRFDVSTASSVRFGHLLLEAEALPEGRGSCSNASSAIAASLLTCIAVPRGSRRLVRHPEAVPDKAPLGPGISRTRLATAVTPSPRPSQSRSALHIRMGVWSAGWALHVRARDPSYGTTLIGRFPSGARRTSCATSAPVSRRSRGRTSPPPAGRGARRSRTPATARPAPRARPERARQLAGRVDAERSTYTSRANEAAPTTTAAPHLVRRR